ncbi:MAG: polyribonucleotide nucleotidyltransferase [Ignavibacteriae bacterium HGW-Ignavibacteriae-4]|jgi:polyribonucleotide nucleotidyltransferase|nr:MAG: polyribonucleotide nucleotidyltransferase [Ignavibacteriae bacterium HGW-Ignavibacteriae-4]
MSLNNPISVSAEIDGQTYTLETGRFAKFANGNVMMSCGDTMILINAIASNKEMDVDFLPLMVDYRERMSASGKIPGGFLKRESRPSTKEILVARLIDRPLRPLFPKSWHFDTQLIAWVMSAQPEIDPENIAATGASAALLISDIPFAGPMSEVRVAKIDGKFKVNPTPEELETAHIDFSVAGTDESIMMVEGECNEINEEEFLEVLDFAHEKIKEFNNLQKELLKLVNKEKRESTVKEIPSEIYDTVVSAITDKTKVYVNTVTTKSERQETRNSLRDEAVAIVEEKFADNEEYTGKLGDYANSSFSKLEKQLMREMILKDGKRLDGRGLTDVRPIETEVGVLPRVHGSSLFTRGETQSLTSVTLGTERDEQMIDGLLPTYYTNFYLHYNFPPFSVGETGRYIGAGRREIGHGALAERALKKLMPAKEDFPYTVRIISDILESNGSSSMATVCAGSMALMHAGVPLKKPVAGIAMGLIKEGDDVAVLTDILGDEDFLGDMDFKVAGTVDGITACQMDIKIDGLSVEIMKKALNQAKEGRLHILDKMSETIQHKNEELSKFAPRFTTLQVEKDEIGTVIGSGGDTIRDITKRSNAVININDDGIVTIATNNDEDAQIALDIIKKLLEKPEEGKVYKGKVDSVREGLGAIVEFLPKKKGLVHISEIQWERTENVADYLKEGQEIDVMLLEATRDGKYRLSIRALLEKPEGYVERPPRPPRDRDDRGGDRRGGDRGGDRRGGGGRDRR